MRHAWMLLWWQWKLLVQNYIVNNHPHLTRQMRKKEALSMHTLCTLWELVSSSDILGFLWECHNALCFHVISLLLLALLGESGALPSQVAQADDFGDSDFAGYQAPRLTIDNCYSDISWSIFCWCGILMHFDIYIYNYIYIHMYILILLYCIHAKHMLLAHLEYVWMRFCAKTTQCGEGPDEWEEVDAGATLNAMSS